MGLLLLFGILAYAATHRPAAHPSAPPGVLLPKAVYLSMRPGGTYVGTLVLRGTPPNLRHASNAQLAALVAQLDSAKVVRVLGISGSGARRTLRFKFTRIGPNATEVELSAGAPFAGIGTLTNVREA